MYYLQKFIIKIRLVRGDSSCLIRIGAVLPATGRSAEGSGSDIKATTIRNLPLPDPSPARTDPRVARVTVGTEVVARVTGLSRRQAFNPPAGIPRELYVPDLAAKLAQIGNGSTYVIAELDGAYTKYYEVTAESEWRGDKAFSDLLIKHKVAYSERVVPTLADLPARIAAEATRGADP